MVRKARRSVAGELHLVVQRVRPERIPLFRNNGSYETYLSTLAALLPECKVAAYAYALLSDRIYLLLRPESEEGVSQLIQAHSRYFVSAMNREFGWRGGLWLDRFACALVDPQWLLRVMRFIDVSPVYSGLVGAPGIYPWSSYAHHIGQQFVSFLQTPSAYWDLGDTSHEREASYREWCQKLVSRADTRHIEQTVLRNGILGEDAYFSLLEQQVGCSLRVRPRGRPAKSELN
ncbi:hypothetical protein CUZ56_00886 [Saezia sanguinis]|uniref:Transposase IS200-like domain-containing protein n=1 Tax=Saezia sanguinis TaxID=1965230 RepID=A0A433SDV9_9BURK|nr:transposase [Saezia sanguinis]RUS66949.1 hypothetical protein CUZ56_00886 [Saezia sanguinis]